MGVLDGWSLDCVRHAFAEMFGLLEDNKEESGWAIFTKAGRPIPDTVRSTKDAALASLGPPFMLPMGRMIQQGYTVRRVRIVEHKEQ